MLVVVVVARSGIPNISPGQKGLVDNKEQNRQHAGKKKKEEEKKNIVIMGYYRSSGQTTELAGAARAGYMALNIKRRAARVFVVVVVVVSLMINESIWVEQDALDRASTPGRRDFIIHRQNKIKKKKDFLFFFPSSF